MTAALAPPLHNRDVTDTEPEREPCTCYTADGRPATPARCPRHSIAYQAGVLAGRASQRAAARAALPDFAASHLYEVAQRLERRAPECAQVVESYAEAIEGGSADLFSVGEWDAL